MLPLCKHPYIKVSTSDENSEEDGAVVAPASYPPSPLKPLCYILGSILVWIALLILSACVSYKLAASNKLQMILSINNFDEVPTAESPYEQNWPGSHLPGWATKKINFSVPHRQEICFTHVGKAGGSTVGCSLGFSLHCHDYDYHNGDEYAQKINRLSSSSLAKRVTHTFHKDVYNCHDDSGYFLFVTRDPIDRIRSAFYYDRPDDNDLQNDTSGWAASMAHFYHQCPFYHIEDFVQNGLRDEGDASKSCKNWALVALQGLDEIKYSDDSPSHWYYNYQYHFEAIPGDSKLLVVRNEHIKEDIRGIENLFGYHEKERLQVSNKLMNTNTWTDQADLYLSSESISILCQALCNEIQIYKKILNQALNLSQDELRLSLMELEAKCPYQTIAEECSDVLPDISEKLIENARGQ